MRRRQASSRSIFSHCPTTGSLADQLTAHDPSPSDESNSTRVAGERVESALYERQQRHEARITASRIDHSSAANHFHSHAFDLAFPSASASYSNTTAIVLRRFHFSDSDSK